MRATAVVAAGLLLPGCALIAEQRTVSPPARRIFGGPSGVPPPPPPPAPSRSSRPAPSPPPGPRVACHPPASDTRPPEGVSVTLDLSDHAVEPGQSVTMTVRVRNTGSSSVRYTRSGYTYDFWVYDRAGNAWVWSHDRAFAQYFAEDTLQPGEERSGTDTWRVEQCGRDGRVTPMAPGRYEVRALWVSSAEGNRGWWSAPVAIEVR